MKALVVYDTKYGNTEKVAAAIAEVLTSDALHVDDISTVDLFDYGLLIIGSPTHGGFPSEGIHAMLKELPDLQSINVAAFDTRTRTTVFGYAAPKIGRGLNRKGASLVAPPEGFLVVGMEGPLMEGELERARDWAKGLCALSNPPT